MKSITCAAACLALIGAGSLSSCAGALGGELIREGVPTGTIQVVNDSRATITVITVSPCDAISHGFNRMSDGATVEPGSSYKFKVSQGCYDVQAGYGFGTGYAVADFDTYVTAGTVERLVVTGN